MLLMKKKQLLDKIKKANKKIHKKQDVLLKNHTHNKINLIIPTKIDKKNIDKEDLIYASLLDIPEDQNYPQTSNIKNHQQHEQTNHNPQTPKPQNHIKIQSLKKTITRKPLPFQKQQSVQTSKKSFSLKQRFQFVQKKSLFYILPNVTTMTDNLFLCKKPIGLTLLNPQNRHIKSTSLLNTNINNLKNEFPILKPLKKLNIDQKKKFQQKIINRLHPQLSQKNIISKNNTNFSQTFSNESTGFLFTKKFQATAYNNYFLKNNNNIRNHN